MTTGWMVASARALGLPDERDVVAALEPALVPDPRGDGKLHARDVVAYERSGGLIGQVGECESIAHVDGTSDYSRFRLLGDERTSRVPTFLLHLVPPPLRRTSGRMSADYFRYSPGAASPPHQDKFGDLVVIWTLDRSGGGAESFLHGLDGRTVMQEPLPAGSVLIFRDEMFLHGVTPLKDGTRDALIFITLKDGA